MGNSHKGVGERARAERQCKITEQMKWINQSMAKLGLKRERICEITNLNVQQAVGLINKGQLTSEQLLDALAFRCSSVGKDHNVFTETNFEWALKAAKACDLHRKESGKRNWTPEDGEFSEEKFLPALYGIPISIKDVFHVEGLATTLGLLGRAKKFLKISRIFASSSSNQRFQLQQSAYLVFTCLSIRIPAELCGVFGIKPYSKRISSQYHAHFNTAFTSFDKSIPVSLGPIARSSKDLALFMDIVTNQKYYDGDQDPYTKIIPFDWNAYRNVEKGEKKYKIGYIKSLQDIQPSHASRRALDQVIDLLIKDGHQLVEVQIPQERDIIRAFIGECSSCKTEKIKQVLKGENPVAEYKSFFQLATMLSTTRSLLSWPLKKFQPRAYTYFFEKKPFDSVIEYQNHLGVISELKTKWVKYWKENQLDFVILPGLGSQAFPHGKSEKISLAAAYTFIWNVLDMSVGAMPVTVVREDELKYETATEDMITGELRTVAEQSLGLPAGIQVVGLPYHEERVLGLMSSLEKKIQFYRKHPLPNI